MKQRYLLCLLLCGVMLYYEIPRLAFNGEETARIFSFMWILLAFFVMAGNLTGMLYSPKSRKRNSAKSSKKNKRLRYYQ